MVDLDGMEAFDIALEIVEQLDDKEIVAVIAELYFLLDTPERVEVKKRID